MVVGIGVIVTVGLGVRAEVIVGDRVKLGVIDGVVEGVGELVGVKLGVAEGVSIGSREDEFFCGPGTVLSTKSKELLSVSSPFPINSSIPPVAIVIDVEELFAFLSTLVPPAGSVREVPSPNVVPGVPKLTASIIVPEANDPLIKAIELSFAIVPLPLLSQLKETFKLVLHHRK